MRRKGGLIIYHGVMLKVELESGGLHSVLIEGLRRKCTESRSLFSKGKKASNMQSGLEPSGLMKA